MNSVSAKRKELLTAKMKEAIHEAAVSVLGQYGVEGMTMERVAAAAKMAKGSLYCYFKSKQDLLRFVHEKLIEPIIQEINDVVASDIPAIEKLKRMAASGCNHVMKHHATFALLHQDSAVRVLIEESDRNKREVAVQQYASVFRQGMAEGILTETDPENLARMFFGAMIELFHRALVSEQADEANSLISQLLEVFLRGALAPASR